MKKRYQWIATMSRDGKKVAIALGNSYDIVSPSIGITQHSDGNYQLARKLIIPMPANLILSFDNF